MSQNRKNIVVVYKSKHGSTKRYAKWIADEVQADLFERSEIDSKDLLNYDTIVYGGSMYVVGILGIDLIRKNFVSMQDKKVIVFSVGASPAHAEAVSAVKSKNFTEDMDEKIHFFYLRGGFDYSKLRAFDKLLIYLLKKKIELKKADTRDNDEIGMLTSITKPVDWTNSKHILPILDCINNHSN
jgi:menaquinone-dependent protoporphyrinogen IX oxidase